MKSFLSGRFSLIPTHTQVTHVKIFNNNKKKKEKKITKSFCPKTTIANLYLQKFHEYKICERQNNNKFKIGTLSIMCCIIKIIIRMQLVLGFECVIFLYMSFILVVFIINGYVLFIAVFILYYIFSPQNILFLVFFVAEKKRKTVNYTLCTKEIHIK